MFLNRSSTIVVTGAFSSIERPRSPRTARASQVPYWTSSGSLRPRSSRIISTSSRVALGPASTWAASPGISFISRKMTTLTPNSTGTAETSRPRT